MKDLKIVAAAVRLNGKILQGKRHPEIMGRIWSDQESVGEEPSRIRQEDQGFVTSDGEFVDRAQAGLIAFQAGQTETRRERLLSEDVW